MTLLTLSLAGIKKKCQNKQIETSKESTEGSEASRSIGGYRQEYLDKPGERARNLAPT